jgi:hypothetical protein
MNAGTDWIDQARRVLEALSAGAGADAPAEAAAEGHASDCRWCPVCQAAAMVRGERPELTAALADVLTATAAALRAFAADPAAAAGPAAERPRDDAEDDIGPRTLSSAQRIDIA